MCYSNDRKLIPITIIDNEAYEKDKNFTMLLLDPIQEPGLCPYVCHGLDFFGFLTTHGVSPAVFACEGFTTQLIGV